MKQRTHRSCAQILNHKNFQKINVWCYKLLNSEQYIMQHKKKLIQSPNILLRVRMYSGSSTTKKNSINNIFSIVTQLSTNRSKMATLSLCHLSFIFNGNQCLESKFPKCILNKPIFKDFTHTHTQTSTHTYSC